MIEKLKTKKGMLLTLLAVAALWVAMSIPHWLRVLQAAQTYLYGYSLVTMGITKDVMSAPAVMQLPPDKRRLGAGPINRFSHVRSFPDHTFKDVVAPNADTLYSIAWLDLSAGPLVLQMPDMQGRWVLMEVLDAWTNAHASLGTRQYGGGKRDYLITGPGWQGSVPEGMVHVASPTRIGWIIGRTYTKNASDFENVHRVQNQYLLEPLHADSAAKTNPPATTVVADTPVDILTPPVRQLARMDAKTFYTRLAALMVDNPPAAADADMLKKLERIGVKPGHPFQWHALDGSTQTALAEGLELGRAFFEGFAPGTQGTLQVPPWKVKLMAMVAERARHSALAPVNGWGVSMKLGDYGTNYTLRALTTLIGLGANVAADAVYPVTTVDADAAPLDGNNRYVLHFGKNEIPPAGAFWSLSLYDKESFFADNPIRRYAIGDRDALTFNPDGSLDLWLQADAPDEARKPNWLPTPKGPFRLMLRIYDPKPEVLSRQWAPPAVRRTGNN